MSRIGLWNDVAQGRCRGAWAGMPLSGGCRESGECPSFRGAGDREHAGPPAAHPGAGGLWAGGRAACLSGDSRSVGWRETGWRLAWGESGERGPAWRWRSPTPPIPAMRTQLTYCLARARIPAGPKREQMCGARHSAVGLVLPHTRARTDGQRRTAVRSCCAYANNARWEMALSQRAL